MLPLFVTRSGIFCLICGILTLFVAHVYYNMYICVVNYHLLPMKLLHTLLAECYRAWSVMALLVTCSCSISFAQSSRLFSTIDDLPNTLVNDVIEDANSMIWVATEYGLCKYDGSKFTTYQFEDDNPHSLQNNYVRTLFVDVEGNLLIGTRRGLQVYRPDTDDFSEVAKFTDGEKESGNVTHIIERNNGEIWMSGNRSCCVRVRPDGVPELYENPFTDKVNFTENIVEDATGRVWLSRHIHDLWYLDTDGKLVQFKQPEDDLSFTTMYMARDGSLYAGGLVPGLFRYNASTNHFDKLDLGGNFLIRSLVNMDNENLLVATDNAGLKVYNCRTGKTSDYYFENEILDLSTQKVHGLCIDHNQVMWLCLYQKGVMMVPQNQQPFHTLGGNALYGNSLGDKCITSILQSSNDDIWVASDNGGVFVLDNKGNLKKHIPYTGLPNSVPSALVKIFEDSKHRYWYGSYGAGYGWIDPVTGRCTVLAVKGQEDATCSIYDFAEDKKGRVWAVSMGAGVFLFDESSRTLVPLPDNDSCRNACCTYLDNTRNKLYVGSYNGLTEFDLEKEDTPARQFMGQYIVFDVCQYTSGRLAVCTTEGLLIFDQNTGEYVRYGLQDGLPSELVMAAECDASGLLWVVTNLGLSCFNEKRRDFINYTAHDGLKSNEFYKNASLKDFSGRLWFGGTDGITYFNPQEVNLEGEKCQVRIVDITSAGRKIKERSSHYFEDNSFSFEIATLPLYRTQHAVYSYSLDGDPWVELGHGQNRVSFSHISSGSHEFRYRAQVSGIESDTMSYNFYVAYPWYRQWWMNLIILALVGVIVYLIYLQWRHRRFVKTRLAQHVQNQAINEAKLQFFMNIAHEIRTPMTMIVSPLQKLISEDDNQDHQHAYRMMQRNANRIVGTINQLMDLRKIDQKQMRLYCSEVEIAPMIRDLCESMQDVAYVRQVELSLVDKAPEGLRLWVDTSNFDKILINLLSNAMKFTPIGGRVEVAISSAVATEEFPDGRFVLKVTDTGEGVPNNEKRRIFERFYQVRSTAAGKTGTGIGLHLTASLVKLHHGTIEVTDNPEGRGTCFTVVLPLGNAHLKGSEISTDPVEASNIEHVTTEEISPDAYVNDTEQVMESAQSHHLVVVAEDDAEIRRYIVQELSAFCRVIECSNGKEALDNIMHQVPDLLLSDVMMPEMDGFELCRKIRSNVRLNHIPIVLLTAKSDEESRIESLDLGADAFLTKPFSMELLRRTIRNLLRSRATLRNTYRGQQMPVDQVEVADAKSPDERLMERILKVVNQNLNNPDLTSEMIASEVGMSRVHLYRKLKELTNQSARNFIRNIRLAKAAELLAQKKCSVAEVADRVGFPNPSNFATSFKEMYGVTPTAYMEEHIKKNEKEMTEDEKE